MMEQMWHGTLQTHIDKTIFPKAEEFAPGLAFIAGFGNIVIVDIADHGLVMIDTGSFLNAEQNFDMVG